MWMLDYNYHDLLYRTIKMHDLVMTGAFVDDDRIERDIKKRVSRKTEDGKKKKGSLSLLLDKIGNLGSSLWQKMATPPTSVEAPSFDSDVDDAVGIFYAMNLNISLAFLTRNGGVFSLGQAFGCDTSPALVKWWRPARMSQLKNPAYKLGLFLYDRYEDELKSFDTLLPDGDVACTSKYKGELDEGHTGWGVPLKDVFSICQDMPEADTGNPPFNLALTRLYSLKGREINMRTPGQTALNDYSMICQPGGGGGGGGGTVEIACELPGGGSSQTCSPGGSATSWQAQASFGMNPIPKEMTVQFDKLMKNIICNEMWGPGPTPEGLPPADPQPGEDAPDSGEPGDPKDEDSEDDADEDTDEDEEADEDRDEEDDTDMGNDKGDKIGGKEETETGQESQDKVAQAPAWFVQAWATALNADEKTLNQIADGIMMIGGADITNNPEMWIEGLEFLLKRAATTVEKEMFLTGAYILGNGIVNPETGEKITLWVIEYDFEKFMEYNEETGKWELSCMAYFDTSDGKVHFSPAVLMLKDGAKLAGHEIGHGALFFVPGLSEAICPGDDSACFNTMHHIVTLYANVYGSYTGKGEMVKEFEEEYGIGKAPQGGGSSGGGGLHFGGSQQQLPLDSAAGVCDVDAILMGLHGFGCGPVYADETGGGPGGGDPLPPPIPWIGTTCMDPPCNDPMGPDSVASSSFNPCGVAGKGVVGSVSEEAMQCWAKDCNPVAMKEFKDMLGQETVPPFLQEKIKTGMPGEN